jgi:hypothetical protein
MSNQEIISFGSSLDTKQKRTWIKIEKDAFEDDPNYVPSFGTSTRPEEDKEYFILTSNGDYVGRAAAVVNKRWIERKGENAGFIDDFVIHPDHRDSADLLIDRCLSRLKEKGVESVMVKCRGFLALLWEGYELTPPYGHPYNPPWYIDIFERKGFLRHKEWENYRGTIPQEVDEEKVLAGKRRIEELDAEVKVVDIGNREEVERYSKLLEKTFLPHFGYNPRDLTQEILSHRRRFLIKIVTRFLRFKIYTAQRRSGEVLGFVVVYPDLNVALKSIDPLSRNPLVFFKLLRSIRGTKRGKLAAIGLMEDLRDLGLTKTIIEYAIKVGRDVEKYEEVDLGPFLTENLPVMKLIERLLKTYGVNFTGSMKYYTLRYEF